jgi:glycosyltransferase involved in cell wall biosynthesis
MRLLLVSDAWLPQVNGVVRTLVTLVTRLKADGHEVEVISPDGFRTIPCPSYPEIRLALFPDRMVRRRIRDFTPDAVHIATEGPLGLAANRYCRSRGIAFTTSYHTRFPEYVHARCRLPLGISYAFLRWFHGAAERVMVATRTIQDGLEERGFTNIVRWTRGVDTELFRPTPTRLLDLPRPILLYTGRVAVEKNIQAFLALDHPGTKVVVGDGPQRAKLERQFPDAVFVGMRHGEDLARHVASADVFVFPSRTDTFGLVLLEALACGVPVAAYPVPGPLDVVGGTNVGVLDEDLGAAVAGALRIDRAACRRFAEARSWEVSVAQFSANLALQNEEGVDRETARVSAAHGD